MSQVFRVAAAAALFAALASTSTASPNAAACTRDAKALCVAEVQSHDRPAVKACLIKNIGRVSADCRQLLQSAPQSPQAPR